MTGDDLAQARTSAGVRAARHPAGGRYHADVPHSAGGRYSANVRHPAGSGYRVDVRHSAGGRHPAQADRPAEHWSVRVHAACTTIAWCCALNALWIAFTLLGGVVLGIGPATVAACILVRRRSRGETVRLREFAGAWRRELWRGSAVMLPVAAGIAVLWWNYAFFSALGPQAGPARLVTLAAVALAIGAGAYVGPMYAHYDLPSRAYFFKATRFALARPASTVILLFVFAALAFATAALPVLLVTVSIGAWLQASTWLCVRFFAENEDRLARAAGPEAVRPDPRRSVPALPVEPLRIR